ncbi:hypothetical protein CALVIDRAFT_600590 [Calocera viscosa TUFC12733]|uniref:BZIP domain-containing protein n=1 Tax=Calocera viscosa (strain TUFC12733) TaxID=1330018 RepID=A0A167JI98_CALVF|nr:hypothetical protein CALVIDRAFT_600590 [Calocera viscosa TUFC12733]
MSVSSMSTLPNTNHVLPPSISQSSTLEWVTEVASVMGAESLSTPDDSEEMAATFDGPMDSILQGESRHQPEELAGAAETITAAPDAFDWLEPTLAPTTWPALRADIEPEHSAIPAYLEGPTNAEIEGTQTLQSFRDATLAAAMAFMDAITAENGALRARNEKLREKNEKLRGEIEVLRQAHNALRQRLRAASRLNAVSSLIPPS